jgi:hypothetical protein
MHRSEAEVLAALAVPYLALRPRFAAVILRGARARDKVFVSRLMKSHSRLQPASIVEVVISKSFPQIDTDLRIGQIELDPDPVKRLLGPWTAGHEENELLMPMAGAEDFFFENLFDFRRYSLHEFHYCPRL